VSIYNHWKRYTPELRDLQKQQLESILAIDVYPMIFLKLSTQR